ncbi:MAG: hypothetical protein PHR39_05100 [Actinomycetota bacterium]|nr:hypothetical protein [Actinomycetota bacterium]
MLWIDIFKYALEFGEKSDIRNNFLNKAAIDKAKRFSYPDSVIINGYEKKQIKNLFVSVDAGTSEIILVRELIKSGLDIDGIFTHHPIGRGYYMIPEVIEIQKVNWIKSGVNNIIAEKLYSKLVWEESIEVRGNHLSAENASRLLNIPLMCVHTPIDNIIQKFFEDLFLSKNDIGLEEAMSIVNSIPECCMASKNGDGPFMINENKNNTKMGNFLVDMTGGVDPPDEIFFHLKEARLNTIVGMHYSLENIKSIIENKLCAIICGHMACDSIGLNLFCDFLESKGLNIICGSGFYRHKRNE